MNFVFDIGNVLIDFKPLSFLHALFHDTQKEEKMNRLVFESREWVELDRGTITQRQVAESFLSREPENSSLIHAVMSRLNDMLTPMPESIDLLPSIKAAGHGLYFLSNYHKELRNYILGRYPFFELFDGGVFSCDIHLLKPSPEIYRYFLSKYALSPGNCVFFDDVEENVRAACACGIHGVLFTGVQDIRQFI